MLDVRRLCVRYGPRTVVDNVDLTVRAGEWLMLAGPNGAGKSTIVNAISRGVPYAGDILFDGTDVRAYKPRALARRMGVLTQNHHVGYAYTVEEVVRLGRYAYAPGVFSYRAGTDDAAVERALIDTGMEALRDRSVLQLSGGELQRTFLAQLFAQDPRLLLLDEPVNHLDPVYQKQVFELLTEWLKTPGRAIVSVVHDLSLAMSYGTHALLLDEGKTVAQGNTAETFTRENLARAFRMDIYEWMRERLRVWAG